MENEGMDLEIIINPKVTDDGQPVIQLETAAGAAVKHFKGAHGVNVPRSRFLPVKSCSDLLLIKSDIYSLEHGQLVINPSRMFENTPVIKLGDHFKKVSLSCLASMKNLLSFTTRQSLTFFFFFHFCADPTVPEAVQEDSKDH
jgi:UDP-N-acetylglucosamine pyrophosphorylase